MVVVTMRMENYASSLIAVCNYELVGQRGCDIFPESFPWKDLHESLTWYSLNHFERDHNRPVRIAIPCDSTASCVSKTASDKVSRVGKGSKEYRVLNKRLSLVE
jgi:hypothetical protein